MSTEKVQQQFAAAVTAYAEESFTLDIDVGAAVSLIATVQLACRHPHFTGPTRQFAEKFARDIQKRLATYDEAISDGIELGWDPQHDVKR